MAPRCGTAPLPARCIRLSTPPSPTRSTATAGSDAVQIGDNRALLVRGFILVKVAREDEVCQLPTSAKHALITGASIFGPSFSLKATYIN
mmetsp:Transcript_28364/g.47076  ORF Transcript_28364/g.47076 Transcript_28364/m.47076 type:complete len:90 (-) Transcript_28364:9-278(-)